MKILYGVVGEGMGHATRSRVVIEHLASLGHDLRIVVSGRAHRFLTERLGRFSNVQIEEIHGLSLRYFGNRLDRGKSILDNLKQGPEGVRKNVQVYRRVAESGFSPELVISDFESWAALYAQFHSVPVISIDNMQVIHRCKHDKALRTSDDLDFRLARWAVSIKIPRAYHYLVSTFFVPPVRKKYTTLVPPILREEILSAKREPGDHVLVYQTADSNHALVPMLQKLPFRFRVYGMGRSGREANVELCPFSETQFVEDLRTARALIAGGGYSLLSEAVSLHVPVFSIPVERQFEQQLNARYVAALGFGNWAPSLEPELIRRFIDNSDEHAHCLHAYPRFGNEMLFSCLSELVERCARGEPKAKALESAALGKWHSKAELRARQEAATEPDGSATP